MDAHLFRLFSEAATPILANARVERIFEPAPGCLCLAFFGGGAKRNLYVRFGRREPFCFISSQKAAAPPKPSAQIMRLRKYCADRRVAAVASQYLSRRLWLMTGCLGEKTVWLRLDLAHGASVEFLTADELPEAENAVWPEPEQLAGALGNWRAWPVLTPPLRRTLRRLETREQWALLADLADGAGDVFLYAENGENGPIRKASAWPLPPDPAAELRESVCENTLECLAKAGRDMVLARIYAEREKRESNGLMRRERQLRRLLETLDRDEAKLLRMRDRGKDAQAIAANLWRLDGKAKAAKLELPGPDGAGPHVVNLPGPALSIGENMEKMFHDARRGKRGLAILRERRAKLEAELAQAQSGRLPFMPAPLGNAAPPAPRTPRRVQAFLSSDGLVMLRGRDAKGNQTVLRMAAGHDIWAHVEKGPGAHVVIRRPHPGYAVPERTLLEAGSLAANKSWLAGAASASVMYAEARHVKTNRKAAAGNVIIARIMATRLAPVDHALDGKLAAESLPPSLDMRPPTI